MGATAYPLTPNITTTRESASGGRGCETVRMRVVFELLTPHFLFKTIAPQSNCTHSPICVLLVERGPPTTPRQLTSDASFAQGTIGVSEFFFPCPM